jgi:hypothetical protein
MTQQLHSISGLATELGRDRRTIAAALSSVPPDGQKGAHPAWYLATALDALSGKKRRPLEDTFIGHLCARLDDWQQIYRGDRSVGHFSIDAAAELFGVDRAAVLTWLRAGMPYSVEGDWRTGAGFEIVVSWTIDWTVMVSGMAVHQGVDALARRRLRLP